MSDWCKVLPMFRMLNPLRSYAWGSTTAFSRHFGWPVSQTPQAELWMGAHPAAPSSVRLEEGADEVLPLDELLRRCPELAGGRTSFPFLVKVLAAEQPLSIQTHPTRERAAAGFAGEDAAGVPVDSPQRSYVDPRHKPELVVALEDFTALCGFRPHAEAEADVAALQRMLEQANQPEDRADEGAGASAVDGTPGIPSDEVEDTHAALGRLRELLAAQDHHAALEAILRSDQKSFTTAAAVVGQLLMTSSAAAAAGETAKTALTSGLSPMTADTLGRTSRAFPGDPGVIVALLLNRVDLSPGEALFLPAGVLHSYLHGVAVEIMANSDNVLRGGLTSKPLHVDELLEVTDTEVLPVPRFTPEEITPRRHRYSPDCEEFQLERLQFPDDVGSLPVDQQVVAVSQNGAAILLCTVGEVLIEALASGQELRLAAGESAFLPPSGSYAVTARAVAQAFVATPGRELCSAEAADQR